MRLLPSLLGRAGERLVSLLSVLTVSEQTAVPLHRRFVSLTVSNSKIPGLLQFFWKGPKSLIIVFAIVLRYFQLLSLYLQLLFVSLSIRGTCQSEGQFVPLIALFLDTSGLSYVNVYGLFFRLFGT